MKLVFTLMLQCLFDFCLQFKVSAEKGHFIMKLELAQKDVSSATGFKIFIQSLDKKTQCGLFFLVSFSLFFKLNISLLQVFASISKYGWLSLKSKFRAIHKNRTQFFPLETCAIFWQHFGFFFFRISFWGWDQYFSMIWFWLNWQIEPANDLCPQQKWVKSVHSKNPCRNKLIQLH